MSASAASTRASWSAAVPATAGLASLALTMRMLLDRGRFPSKLALAVHAGAPLLLGALLLAGTFLRPSLRGRLTVAVVALAIALYAAEIAVRRIAPADLPDLIARSRAAEAAGVRFDRRSQLEVVADLRKSGARAFPMASPASVMEPADDGRWRSSLSIDGAEVVPLGGVARARIPLGNESGVMPTFVSDEMGFNNPAGIWGQAPVSVMLLGDSFAIGWGVAPEKSVAAVVRERFPRTVNLGATGLGPLGELAGLRELGPALRPEAVVMLFYEGNDLRDLNREKLSLLARYLDPGFTQGLAARRDAIDRALAAHLEAKIDRAESFAPRTLSILELARLAEITEFATSRRDGSGKADYALHRRVLHEAAAATEAWGGKLWLVFLPKWSRFAQRDEVPALDHARAQVLRAAEAEGIPVIDVVDLFAATGDPLALFPYRMHGHYNERGHAILGEAIARALSEPAR